MRNISQVVAATLLLASQASAAIPAEFAASATARPAADEVRYEVRLNTDSPQAVEVTGPKQPNFDSEVLAPLRAAQTEEAVQAAARAAEAKRLAVLASAQAKLARTATRVVVATGDAWEQLRNCEAGGDYARNSGNGYYGAYQFDLSTWANYGGYARPDLAPPSVQDAKAQATQAARGWSPWPACARKLGLM